MEEVKIAVSKPVIVKGIFKNMGITKVIIVIATKITLINIIITLIKIINIKRIVLLLITMKM